MGHVTHHPKAGLMECIMAERLPEQLDDEIKKVLYAWQVACGRITPEDIRNCIPITVPTLNAIPGVVGISRFDFKAWGQLGQPTLSKAGWIALCSLISSKDPVNLGPILTLCESSRL